MAGEIEFVPAESDLRDAQRHHWLRSQLRRSVLAFYAVLLIACLAVALLVEGLRFLVPCVLGGAAIGQLVAWLNLGRVARRQFRQQKSLHQAFRYGWSDEGVAISSALGSGAMPWAMWHGWSASKAVFLLYAAEGSFHFIPRRAMRAEQAADLEATLASSGVGRL